MEAISVQLHELHDDPKSRPVLIVTAVCSACLFLVLYCISVTRSLVLTACAWLTIFAVLSLCASLVSQRSRTVHATLRYSYGYARAPVLAVFTCTVLAQLSAVFLMKESVEHLLEGETHGHSHWVYLPAVVIATGAQLLAAYGVRNEPMSHVLNAASSSWLQEHAADVSQALCRLVPGASRLLLPRLNAIGLLSTLAAVTGVTTYYLLEHYGLWWADAAGALCMSLAVLGTFAPLSAYTGRILLQTSPAHAAIQLDKCVREAETLDGVLEVAQVHFWQLDFARMAGTVVVRVRREADEQRVTAHVTDKLSACVAQLTVQVLKSAETPAVRAAAATGAGAGGAMSTSYSWHDFGDKARRERHNSGHDGYAHDQGHGHGHSHEHAAHGHGHSHDNHNHAHAH